MLMLMRCPESLCVPSVDSINSCEKMCVVSTEGESVSVCNAPNERAPRPALNAPAEESHEWCPRPKKFPCCSEVVAGLEAGSCEEKLKLCESISESDFLQRASHEI